MTTFAFKWPAPDDEATLLPREDLLPPWVASLQPVTALQGQVLQHHQNGECQVTGHEASQEGGCGEDYPVLGPVYSVDQEIFRDGRRLIFPHLILSHTKCVAGSKRV